MKQDTVEQVAHNLNWALRAALPVLISFRDAHHDSHRGEDDPALVGVVRRAEKAIEQYRKFMTKKGGESCQSSSATSG